MATFSTSLCRGLSGRQYRLISLPSLSRSLSNVPTISRYNTITEDKRIFVCYHPKVPTPISHTKSLQPYKPWLAQRNRSLSQSDVELVKKLRNKDPFIWTVNILASLFNVSQRVICEAGPLSQENREMIRKEKEYVSSLRFFRRKKYVEERQKERKIKLKEAFDKIDYNFPGKLPDFYL